jgi:hypothetical protein
MNELSIEIASVPHREELVAELWCGAEQVAELSQDGGRLVLQVFPRRSGVWEFDYDQFRDATARLRIKLLGDIVR